MYRSYLLRLRPTKRQAADLCRVLSISCELYNAALQERRDAWKIERKRINYFDQQKQITELRKVDDDCKWLSVDLCRDPIRRIDNAFQGFFRRAMAGRNPGHPRFKACDRYNSFGTSIANVRGSILNLPKLGGFKFKCPQGMRGKLMRVTVKKCGRRWEARALCDIGDPPERNPVSLAVGIDVGIKTFVTLSDGSWIDNPKWERRCAERIAKANRQLIRKKFGSKNRAKCRESRQRAYAKAKNCRSNFIHHVSKYLVRRFDLIAYEALKIESMVEGSSFGKSVMDAAWGILIAQLIYKAEEAGKWVVPVDPKGTTQRCSGCNNLVPKTIMERVHSCSHCGLILGRDHNAALNILALGRSAVAVGAEGLIQPATTTGGLKWKNRYHKV